MLTLIYQCSPETSSEQICTDSLMASSMTITRITMKETMYLITYSTGNHRHVLLPLKHLFQEQQHLELFKKSHRLILTKTFAHSLLNYRIVIIGIAMLNYKTTIIEILLTN